MKTKQQVLFLFGPTIFLVLCGDIALLLVFQGRAHIFGPLLILIAVGIFLLQIVGLSVFAWYVHKLIIRVYNTSLFLKEARENALLISAEDAPESMPVDPEMLTNVQDCIRYVANIDSTKEFFKKQMQLSILQSQINPHFLYNTLDAIRGQAQIEGCTDLADIIETLSTFFRYSISIKKDYVSIEDELKNVTSYIKIQQYRFEDRFSYSVEYDEQDELDQYILPKLTLQPLVENAIYHAFEKTKTTGNISIRIVVLQNRISITVSDNGIGMTEQQVDRINSELHAPMYSPPQRSRGQSNGLALRNVNDRIILMFGKEYGLTVYSILNMGTDIEISLPKKKQEDIDEEHLNEERSR